jgi:hypothetical protein
LKTCSWRIVLAAVTVASILTPQAATGAYSVFTHEAGSVIPRARQKLRCHAGAHMM